MQIKIKKVIECVRHYKKANDVKRFKKFILEDIGHPNNVRGLTLEVYLMLNRKFNNIMIDEYKEIIENV